MNGKATADNGRLATIEQRRGAVEHAAGIASPPPAQAESSGAKSNGRVASAICVDTEEAAAEPPPESTPPNASTPPQKSPAAASPRNGSFLSPWFGWRG
jgi:hypothetical protein